MVSGPSSSADHEVAPSSVVDQGVHGWRWAGTGEHSARSLAWAAVSRRLSTRGANARFASS